MSERIARSRIHELAVGFGNLLHNNPNPILASDQFSARGKGEPPCICKRWRQISQDPLIPPPMRLSTFFPEKEVRQFVDAEITHQWLKDQGIVQASAAQIALNLHFVE